MRRVLARAMAVAVAMPAAALAVQACTGDDKIAGDAGLDASIKDAAVDGADDDVYVDAGPCAPVVVAIDAQAPDGGIECGIFQRFPCGLPSDPPLTLYSDCYFLLDDCAHVCPGSLYFNCHMYGNSCVDGSVVPDADIVVECATCPNGVGRRPRGLRIPGKNKALSRVGAFFAEAAHLEGASVHAFRILRRELAALGAPKDLLEGAARAEADEIRHTRATTRLARANGATPKRARVKRGALRSLEAIALENAVEGCVRETFGAAFAMWQGENAADPAVASAMRKIARDEARHAALSWSVARWADTRLDPTARRRIERAKATALRDLEAELGRRPHPELEERAGVPPIEKQRAMLRVLATELHFSA